MRRAIRSPMLEPKRILICRLSAIGDCVLTIPLAVKIKELWPSSHLTWVVDCAAAQLLQDHPAIDELIKIERHWVTNRSAWKNLRQTLTSRRFDVSFDPQGLIKSSLLAWISGARVRVGFDYSHGRELAPLLANRRVRRTARHMADTYLELLSPWTEIVPGQAKFNMPAYQDAVARLPELLKDAGLRADESYLCISPGAGWATKVWPISRFAEVARSINSQYHLRTLVVWAGESERLMAQAIAEKSSGSALAAPKSSLRELAEIARKSQIFIAGDTGPLHIAASVGAPCIGLFGPTWSDESSPYGSGNMAVQSPVLPTGRSMRHGNNAAMQAIEVEEVLLACHRMLQNRHRRIA